MHTHTYMWSLHAFKTRAMNDIPDTDSMNHGMHTKKIDIQDTMLNNIPIQRCRKRWKKIYRQADIQYTMMNKHTR